MAAVPLLVTAAIIVAFCCFMMLRTVRKSKHKDSTLSI